MSRHTLQTSTAQQKISNFLYAEDSATAVPQRFVEFCRHSVQGIRGNVLYADPADPLQFGRTEYDGAESCTLNLKPVNEQNLVPLQPIHTSRPVVAVDTSTLKLGELEDGVLCALRGAIVLLENGRYRFVRYGPFVFLLSYNPLASEHLANIGLPPFSPEPNIDNHLKRVRNMLERWLQLNVSLSTHDAFVLIDGSLTAGTPDNPSRELERILENTHRSNSVLIAISKKTRLRVNDQSLTELLKEQRDPCLLDVDAEVAEQFPPYPVRFLGRVFVGKLARLGYPFRIDLDRHVLPIHAPREFSELMGTDIVDQGYPETLRLAHIFSTFTATDVLAMQSFASAHLGVQLMPKVALRRSLFGPFGTAWESYH